MRLLIMSYPTSTGSSTSSLPRNLLSCLLLTLLFMVATIYLNTVDVDVLLEIQKLETAHPTAIMVDPCAFREYPSHQYYSGKFLQQEASFVVEGGEDNTVTTTTNPLEQEILSQSDYLYGELPLLLTPSPLSRGGTGKICSPAQTSSTATSSLADGTNPSILSISRLQRHLPSNHPLLQHALKLTAITTSDQPFFVGTLIFKRPEAMQCHYNPNNNQVQKGLEESLFYDSKSDYPRGTWFAILDMQGQIIWKTQLQMTPVLQLLQSREDSLARALAKSSAKPLHTFSHDVMDDPRLFLHNSQLWVSYKSGKYQKFNPLHFDILEEDDGNENSNNSASSDTKTTSMTVSMRDHETVPVCCGRNMAVLEQPTTPAQSQTFLHNDANIRLSLVAWVDPLTVIQVHDNRNGSSLITDRNNDAIREMRRMNHRSLSSISSTSNNTHHSSKTPHLHGTSGFLLRLPETNEYIGLAHFHKGKNKAFALWGHHYTHAFYTLSANDHSSDTAASVTRLSPEFVLPSQSTQHPLDGNVIQFVSGLELVELHDDKTTNSNQTRPYLVISYGINDCEGAVFYIALSRVLDFLRPVNATGGSNRGESLAGSLLQPAMIYQGAKGHEEEDWRTSQSF